MRDPAKKPRVLCRHRLGRDPAGVALLGVDCDRLDLRAAGARLRLDFPAPVTRAADVAAALTRLVTVAR